MKLKLKVYSALCALEQFEINGIDADKDDFGSQGDESPETAEEYGCGDMRFTSKNSTEEVLNKYNISEKEYQQIVEKLEDKLSFGACSWCV